MRDGFSREIEYLRLSVTERCNFFCRYCRTKDACAFEAQAGELTTQDFFKIISAFKTLGIKKLRLTGGEPFLRDDIFEIVDFAYGLGIKNINVTTNGFLNDDCIRKIIESKLEGINVSLDTLDREKYRRLTGVDGLDVVINAIKALSKYKKVKLNTVLLKTVNSDEVENLILFAKGNDVIVRFIELMPIGVANRIFNKEFVSTRNVLKKFKGFQKVDDCEKSVAEYYYIEDFEAVVGFIKAMSEHFCSRCNKVRVSSRGVLYNCLFDENGFDLKEYLTSEDVLVEKINQFVMQKKFARSAATSTMMFKIGG
ncbi:cyclic pyranopterin phosphate synthase [Caldicoprobacter guelmensis]|uniref:GTP 3',8-cyclase MoaA n=1 Tax=Caldicoprobacter guelmensis TaxID=1170224 RepID=UPI00195BDA76|nr:GTP 3',8-cyclase MoaA [Caldicoprobacter guelmensis]MBM7582770.1 cyclic pyranopterin phosphate synthase [Caldicoprobacter guelmensis]